MNKPLPKAEPISELGWEFSKITYYYYKDLHLINNGRFSGEYESSPEFDEARKENLFLTAIQYCRGFGNPPIFIGLQSTNILQEGPYIQSWWEIGAPTKKLFLIVSDGNDKWIGLREDETIKFTGFELNAQKEIAATTMHIVNGRDQFIREIIIPNIKPPRK